MSKVFKLVFPYLIFMNVSVPVDGLALFNFNDNSFRSPYGVKKVFNINNGPSLLVSGSDGLEYVKSDNYFSCIGIIAYYNGKGLLAHLNPSGQFVKDEKGVIIGYYDAVNAYRNLGGEIFVGSFPLLSDEEHIRLNNYDYVKYYVKLMKETGLSPHTSSVVLCGGDETFDYSLELLNRVEHELSSAGYSFTLADKMLEKSVLQDVLLDNNGTLIIKSRARKSSKQVYLL